MIPSASSVFLNDPCTLRKKTTAKRMMTGISAVADSAIFQSSQSRIGNPIAMREQAWAIWITCSR